jgi:hypothetical protein
MIRTPACVSSNLALRLPDSLAVANDAPPAFRRALPPASRVAHRARGRLGRARGGVGVGAFGPGRAFSSSMLAARGSYVGGAVARARRISGRDAGCSSSSRRASSNRRGAPCVPRAVSIYDAVRGDDSERDTIPSEDSVPDPPALGPAASRAAGPPPGARDVVPPAPLVPPAVISSRAAMLASAENLAEGVDVAAEDPDADSRRERDASLLDEGDGIVRWTVKYVDRALDDIEKEKPATAEAAWKIGRAGERVANNPAVRAGGKLAADVGVEVVKVGVRAAAPVVGGIGKFAAKKAFDAAIGGIKNPLKRDPGDAKKKAADAGRGKDPGDVAGGAKKKKIVKLTAAEAEERRRQGKVVRKVEKKKGKGFFGL